MSDGSVNVKNLTDRFNVSIETVRRDLEYLEKKGYLKRVYGGAVAVSLSPDEPSYHFRKEHNYSEKLTIGAKAAELVNDGDTLLMSHGTSTIQVARHLRGKKNLTVVTNSLNIAAEFNDCPAVSVFCLGGSLRHGEFYTAGVLAEQNIARFNADKLILGIGGITLEHGITDYHVDESELLRLYVQSSACVIGVADHSKFGLVCTFNLCPAQRLTHLVTDSAVGEATLAPFREHGIQVHVAGAK